MSTEMTDHPSRVHIVLQARHWPSMLNFTAPGDRLIVGGSALLAVLAEAELQAVLNRHQLALPEVLAADCEAYGIKPCPGMQQLDDDGWVRAVADAREGVIQW